MTEAATGLERGVRIAEQIGEGIGRAFWVGVGFLAVTLVLAVIAAVFGVRWWLRTRDARDQRRYARRIDDDFDDDSPRRGP